MSKSLQKNHTNHSAFFTAFEDTFPKRMQQNISLAPFTTFKIGGPAQYFFEASSSRELSSAVLLARRFKIPHFVLGLGANLLFGDGGFSGIVIKNSANRIEIDTLDCLAYAESGAIIYPNLIEKAIELNLGGIEHFAGIPSTVGGALWQNLHFLSPPPERTRTVFIEEVLLKATILDQEGEIRSVQKDYFNFGYDFSILHVRNDIVLDATFQLTPKSQELLLQTIEANLSWRNERHPPLDTQPSAGSIFKKIEGIGAGRLIDECGLKGFQIGGAQISRKHANFIVNTGNATANDVISLIQFVQKEVKKQTGYLLETEISFIGNFV